VDFLVIVTVVFFVLLGQLGKLVCSLIVVLELMLRDLLVLVLELLVQSLLFHGQLGVLGNVLLVKQDVLDGLLAVVFFRHQKR